MAIKNYSDLQTALNTFVTNAKVASDLAPHQAFWNNLSYQQFITGDIPGMSGFKILVVGNAAESNIIMALSGTQNSPFDPSTGTIGQMPQPSPPYPDQQSLIDDITAWINAGCPN